MNHSLLIVEDDTELADMMYEFLSAEGFPVTVVHDGKHAIKQILSLSPDLVILDLMLPGSDGVEVCRQVRPEFTNPIIMLTASDNEFAEISALNLGADSYLTKPIKPQVLLAHIKAMLRRDSQSQPNTQSEHITVQDVSINSASRQVTLNNNLIEFTSGEFELLWVLMQNAGGIVSRDELYQQVRGMEYDGIDRSIDLRISHIRKKLGDEIKPYRYLKTVRNKGYIFALS